VFIGGTIAAPFGLQLSPLIVAQSNGAYNITVGEDLNGDSIFNDRPAFATSQTLPANLAVTPIGNFDKAPGPGAPIIPINYGVGVARITTNLRIGRTFNLNRVPERPASGASAADDLAGAEASGARASGPRRYSLTFNVDARNIFNKVNRANPIGNLSSSLFGQSNALAGPPYATGAAVRRIDLQLVFAF
jgi:hypothetical protein